MTDETQAPEAVQEDLPTNGWRIVEQAFSKADAGAVRPQAFEVEDEFKEHYGGADGDVVIIQPPYDLKLLERLSQTNNTLPACIEAMISNIDGTGYTFAKKGKHDNENEDTTVDILEETFSNLGIDESFITLRKKLRRDIEQVGNGYLEIIRNVKGDIIFVRHVDAKMVRLVRLDDPVTVTKSVTRGGKTFEVDVEVRERRYVQMVGGRQRMYFKEFGSERNLDKTSGQWENTGIDGVEPQPIEPGDLASEMLHFTCNPDAYTPYGVPRWISQIPSVMGSRKAEEFNLDFFNNGGIPPAIVFLQGGTLTGKTAEQMKNMNLGTAVQRNRLAIIELEGTDGALDKGSSNVRATVERFGSDRQADSMFEKYDERCTERVSRAYRLPPLFLGQSDDYNFATSHTAYMVAEQQVFLPERDEFDEVISIRLLPAMGYPEYKLQSKPLTLKNSDNLLKGATTAKSIGGVSGEQLIETVNDATGTDFKYDADFDTAVGPDGKPLPPEESFGAGSPFPPKQNGGGKAPNTDKSKDKTLKVVGGTDIKKSEGLNSLVFELRDNIVAQDKEALEKSLAQLAELPQNAMDFVREQLAKMVFLGDEAEVMGLSELAGCGQVVLANEILKKGHKKYKGVADHDKACRCDACVEEATKK